MKRRLGVLAVATLSLMTAGAWAVAGEGAGRENAAKGGGEAVEKVVLHDATGARVGRVWLRQRGGYVHVWANLWASPPGFHGFHVHATGLCEVSDPAAPFTSAGGHYNPDTTGHGQHAGDLPSLLVTESGWARLAFVTDAFTLADLRDADGSALMVHAGPDNFANIPTRYTSTAGGTGPDAATLLTGDAGSRYACGVVD